MCVPEWLSVDNVRSFAGPVATVVASAIAAYFAWAQVKVAKAQAAIAQDKLKSDLFERRYAIYNATKELIEYMLMRGGTVFETEFVRSRRVKIDESRFFFDRNVRESLSEIDSECEKYLKLNLERGTINTDDHGSWARAADGLAAQELKIEEFYKRLPQIFEKSLAFRQLTELNQ